MAENCPYSGENPEPEIIPLFRAITLTGNTEMEICTNLYARAAEINGGKFDATNCVILTQGQLRELDIQLRQNSTFFGLNKKYIYEVTKLDTLSYQSVEADQISIESWGVFPLYGEDGIEKLPLVVRWYLGQAVIQDMSNTCATMRLAAYSSVRLKANGTLTPEQIQARISGNEQVIQRSKAFLLLEYTSAKELFKNEIGGWPWFDETYMIEWKKIQEEMKTFRFDDFLKAS